MEPKHPSDSQVEMTELMLPNDANTLGNVLGGKVLHLVDIAAALAAHRHCRRQVVTASMDRVDFHHPVKIGQVMTLRASVNFVSRTSMEVGVKVLAENLMTGETRHTASAYATFVALDDLGHPTPVPPLEPVTDDDRRRMEEGKARRELRMSEIRRKRERQSGTQGTESAR
ncbi:MAG: acyl-CoA thioesterase [Candidatus Eisenbacteria bacterium]